MVDTISNSPFTYKYVGGVYVIYDSSDRPVFMSVMDKETAAHDVPIIVSLLNQTSAYEKIKSLKEVITDLEEEVEFWKDSYLDATDE